MAGHRVRYVARLLTLAASFTRQPDQLNELGGKSTVPLAGRGTEGHLDAN
jgi:hypothetical protein